MFRPPVNRAMRVLDRSFFKKDVQLAAARVPDAKQLAHLRSELHKSKDLLALRMVMPVRPDPTDPHQKQKCILLRPEIKHDDRQSWGKTVSALHDNGLVSLIPYLLSLEYSHWTAGEILSAVLPDELAADPPTGFNPAGHVAHFNLRDKYLPYKHLIGQVTMDKNPTITTVINKTDTLNSDNEFRVLDYELVVGDPDLHVEVREASSVFRFDYSKVYWNSRLGTEHQRLVDKFQPGEAVCDVMAGVGPFAVPAGRKGVFVWANDLNPNCYNGLVEATQLNKTQQHVRCFNQDGHAFIKAAANDILLNDHVARVPLKISRKEAIARNLPPAKQFQQVAAPKTFSHYVMNLPATAIDFLPDFIGLYHDTKVDFQRSGAVGLPLIHCYCFGPKSDDEARDRKDAENTIWAIVADKLNFAIDRDHPDSDLYDVRDVAPNKRMFCATFRLPAEVAFLNASA